jgi:putative ABC transport system permease protein
MKMLKQILALLQMSLGGMPQRLGASVVTVIGIACVVGVLVAMLSMGTGVREFGKSHVRADRSIVLSKEAVGVNNSSLSRSAFPTVADMPGIKKDVDGKPVIAAQTIVFTNGLRKRDNARVAVLVLGVTEKYWSVYPEVTLTAGRMFSPGVHELIVGKSQHEQIKGLELGDNVRMFGSNWKVVGHFDAERNLNLNLITDADTLMSAANRSVYNVLDVMLDSPASFGKLQAAIKNNASLDVDLKTESAVVEEASKQLAGPLNFVSYFIGVIMAIGATLGAVTAMYAVVDERKREIATLRAIGFKNFPIITSILIETLLLALPGAAIGIAVAWVFFNGNTISPVGISFKLAVTPALAVLGVMWAVLMGLIGGLFPAIRAARMQVVNALRAV